MFPQAGGDNKALDITVPAGITRLFKSNLDWQLYSDNQEQLDDRKVAFPLVAMQISVQHFQNSNAVRQQLIGSPIGQCSSHIVVLSGRAGGVARMHRRACGNVHVADGGCVWTPGVPGPRQGAGRLQQHECHPVPPRHADGLRRVGRPRLDLS